MVRLSLLQRAALTAYFLPFFVGGILLGALPYLWLGQHAHLPAWSWPLMLVFAVVGILLGALIAYFILMFVLFWLVPRSPLLAEGEADAPTLSQRILFPLFHAVRALAQRLAPKGG